MKINSNFSGDALEISDDQVAGDWTLGMLREVTRQMADRIRIMRPSTMYGWQATIDWEATKHFRDQDACSVASAVGVEDGVWEESNSDGTVDVFEVVSATVSCACGSIENRTGQAYFEVGRIFSTIANS